MSFQFEPNARLNITLLSSVDSIVEQLEADNNSLQSMLSDRFVEFFQTKVQTWQRNIGAIDVCVNKWIEIQRKCTQIFVQSADIRDQLPEDSKRFGVADDMFRQLMAVSPLAQTY